MVAIPSPVAPDPVKLPWSKPVRLTAEPSLAPRIGDIATFLQTTIADAIHLVAIVPDGQIMGRWFGDDATGAADWAAQCNKAGSNVYWTVNRVREGLNSKPKKTDIVAARFAHVDVDPPKGGAALDRGQLLTAMADLGDAPSFVIDSGGGVQGFWRLAEESVNLADIEAVNRGVGARLGGDHCWNIDRLMRVPGTVNWPDRRKRERGRIPAMATVAVEDDGTIHDSIGLAHRFPAPAQAAAEQRPDVDMVVTALLTADDLGLGAFDPVRMAIEHPPARDRSRDAQAVAGDMVRAGFSDDQIMGVLLNPANAVSAHCLGQRNAPRAAARCLQRARSDQTRRDAEVAEGAAIAAGMGIVADPAAATPAGIRATPYTGRVLAAIPPRPWLYGRYLLRNTVSVVVAPGGVGKSSLMVGTALALATGQSILAKPIFDGPHTVWLWNLEDDGDELARQIEASCQRHDLTAEDYGDRLYVDSGLDGNGLCTAIEGKQGVVIIKPVFDALEAEIRARGVDVLIVDPFVSSHQVDENANTKIDAIAKEWARLAKRTACSIVLVHHAGKLAGRKVGSEASRGASSLVAAARSTLVLNRLDEEEAKVLGVHPNERRRIFSVGDDKHNRAPAEEADWYRLESVSLGNGGIEGGDSVGVVVPWTPPQASEQVSATDLRRVQTAIASGSWRYDTRVKEAWVGAAIADALGLSTEQDKSRLLGLIKAWLGSGALKKVMINNADTNYRDRPYVEVGTWVAESDPPVTTTGGN